MRGLVDWWLDAEWIERTIAVVILLVIVWFAWAIYSMGERGFDYA